MESGRAGVSVARQQLEAARAQLEQAIANDIKAQNDVGRYKQLVDKQEISHQQYDQAVAAARSSAAGVAAARASASAAEQMVSQAQAKRDRRKRTCAPLKPRRSSSVIRSRAEAAQAQAQQKKAELDQAMLNLQYTRVVAPINGIVSNRTVEVGQNVQIGQELMKIINLDDIWVTANFKETQLRHMRPGQRGYHLGGCVRKKIQRSCGKYCRRKRCTVQLVASGKCHRQLCESGAASPGEDHL